MQGTTANGIVCGRLGRRRSTPRLKRNCMRPPTSTMTTSPLYVLLVLRQKTNIEIISLTNLQIPNPSVAALYEDALVYETGSAITSSGALTAYSGAKTGRSPLDKRIVKEPSSENDVWWGPVNKPMTPEVSSRLFHSALFDGTLRPSAASVVWHVVHAICTRRHFFFLPAFSPMAVPFFPAFQPWSWTSDRANQNGANATTRPSRVPLTFSYHAIASICDTIGCSIGGERRKLTLLLLTGLADKPRTRD